MEEKQAGVFGLLGKAYKGTKEGLEIAAGTIKKDYKNLFSGTMDEAAKTDISKAAIIRMSLPLLGIAAGTAGAAEAGQAITGAIKTRAAQKSLIQDPELKDADPEKIDRAYGALKEYAPSIARDKLISQMFVKGVLQMGHINYSVATDLMKAEKIYQELKAKPFTALDTIRKSSKLI